jgi:hypothetical protein
MVDRLRFRITPGERELDELQCELDKLAQHTHLDLEYFLLVKRLPDFDAILDLKHQQRAGP